MAENAETQPEEIPGVELSVIKPEQLTIIQGLEKRQLEIVEKNPFVKITDKATYEKAKQHRTNLLTASTTVEKEDDNFGRVARNFIAQARAKIIQCAKLTRDPYEKQQEEVKRHEKILQDEIDRKAKIAKEREDRIKASIEFLIQEYNDIIEVLTYDSIATQTEHITESIKNHRGTFEEFDILFNRDSENVLTRLSDKTQTLTSAFEQAEELRKKAHTDKIAEIELKIKTIVLDLTPENFEAKEKEFQSIANGEYNFEEFDADYKAKHEELATLFLNKSNEIHKALESERQHEADQKELEELRAKNRYNDRSKTLIEIGMAVQENGDFAVLDLTYSKGDIIADELEIFEQTVENIIKFIETETKKENEETPAAETAVEPAAQIPGEVATDYSAAFQQPQSPEEIAEIKTTGEIHVNGDLQAGNPEEKLSGAIEVIESTIPKWERIGYVTTAGEMRAALAEYGDDVPLGFVNQPVQVLFKITSGGDVLLGFHSEAPAIENVMEGK